MCKEFCRDKCIQFSFLHFAKKNTYTNEKEKEGKEKKYSIKCYLASSQFNREIFSSFSNFYFFFLLLRRSVWTDRTNIVNKERTQTEATMRIKIRHFFLEKHIHRHKKASTSNMDIIYYVYLKNCVNFSFGVVF